MNKQINRVAGLVAVVLIAGCCNTPEAGPEPNDTPDQATSIAAGQTIEGRVVEDNLDIFSVTAGPAQTLRFQIAATNPGDEEDCVAFAVTAPDGTVLYRETQNFCGQRLPKAVEGAALTELADEQYELVVPAAAAGTYLLTLDELGQADNICDFRWSYRVSATTE